MNEQLSEGWVKFFRRTFADGGTIDYWIGDCVNNPNNPTKSNIQLNSFNSCFRLNGGEWVDSRDLFKMYEHWNMTDLPAQIIWDNCYTDYQKLLKEQK